MWEIKIELDLITKNGRNKKNPVFVVAKSPCKGRIPI
jgi:hypothetical protein